MSAQSQRLREADLIAASNTLDDWIRIVRAEYLEMPGLHLTSAQMQRLFNLERTTCDTLLKALVDAGFLRRTAAGGYVRFDGGAGR